MPEHEIDGLTIVVEAAAISLDLVYPDGSRVQLTMPKPTGVEVQTDEQIELLARRLGCRLLGVAAEDLGGGVGLRARKPDVQWARSPLAGDRGVAAI